MFIVEKLRETLPVGMSTHCDASVESIVSVSREHFPIPILCCSQQKLDLWNLDSFTQELSHMRAEDATAFMIDAVIERRLSGWQKRYKFQVDFFVRLESLWPQVVIRFGRPSSRAIVFDQFQQS